MARLHPHAEAPPRRLLRQRAGRISAVLVVALVLIGQLLFLGRALANIGGESFGGRPVVVPRSGTLSQRVSVILASSLGASDRGVRRFRLDSIRRDPRRPGLRVISITWAINNDLAEGTIGNGAASDIYLMLRNLFNSGLPLSGVRLRGTYDQGGTGETTVLRVGLARHTAALVGREGWDSLDGQSLWPLLDRPYVAPDFQPQPSE